MGLVIKKARWKWVSFFFCMVLVCPPCTRLCSAGEPALPDYESINQLIDDRKYVEAEKAARALLAATEETDSENQRGEGEPALEKPRRLTEQLVFHVGESNLHRGSCWRLSSAVTVHLFSRGNR